jgi:hypothetical protein
MKTTDQPRSTAWIRKSLLKVKSQSGSKARPKRGTLNWQPRQSNENSKSSNTPFHSCYSPWLSMKSKLIYLNLKLSFMNKTNKCQINTTTSQSKT